MRSIGQITVGRFVVSGLKVHVFTPVYNAFDVTTGKQKTGEKKAWVSAKKDCTVPPATITMEDVSLPFPSSNSFNASHNNLVLSERDRLEIALTPAVIAEIRALLA